MLRGYGPLAADEAGRRHGDAAAAARRPGRGVVAGRGARGAVRRTRSGSWPSAASPTRCRRRTRSRRSSSAGANHVAGRHRPDLDPAHARGGRCWPPRWTRRRTSPSPAPSVAGEAVSPSTDLLAGWLAAGSDVKVKRSPAEGGRGPGVGAAGPPVRPGRAGPPGRQDRAACASPGSRTGWSRSPAARCATASPRSCAGSTPTRSTARRSPASARVAPRPHAGQGARAGRIVTMAAPDIVVHAHPDVLAAAAAARLITRLVDLQAAGDVPKVVLTGGGIGIAMLEQMRATVGPGRRRLGAASSSTGATSGSCRPATRSATRRRPARRCSTTSRSTRRKVFPMGADTGTGPAGAEAAAAEYAECWPARPARRTTGRCPPSTCCCSAWAARATPRRSSRTPPRCTRPSARWWRCTAARSRRPPGSR